MRTVSSQRGAGAVQTNTTIVKTTFVRLCFRWVEKIILKVNYFWIEVIEFWQILKISKPDFSQPHDLKDLNLLQPGFLKVAFFKISRSHSMTEQPSQNVQTGISVLFTISSSDILPPEMTQDFLPLVTVVCFIAFRGLWSFFFTLSFYKKCFFHAVFPKRTICSRLHLRD